MSKLFRVKAATPNRILNTAHGIVKFDKNAEAVLPEDVVASLPTVNYRVLGEEKNPGVQEVASLVDEVTPPSGQTVDDDVTSSVSDNNADEESVEVSKTALAPDEEKPSAETGRNRRKRTK